MNKFVKSISFGFVALAFVMVSCSDDKEEPTPETTPTPGEETTVNVDPATVFTNGLPTQVGDYVITKNSDGLVTKIVEGDKIITFDYAPVKTKSRAAARPADYDMTMNVEWGSDADGVDFFIKLNAQGYIEYAFEEDEDEQDGITFNEWWFKYNDKGQLIEMKRTEGDNEVTTINYNEAGDITSISLKDDMEGQKMTATVGYTDATHTSPIVNKSGIMLYDDSFRIDMDEMSPAYYAGLLGKGTAHLPLTNKEVSHEGTDDYTFVWEFDANDMPVKFTSTCTNQWGTNTDKPINLRW